MSLKIFDRRFRPRWWALVLAAAACAAGVALGNWQSGRAADKRALAVQLAAALGGPALELPARAVAAADYAMKRVAVRGEFVPQHTVLLDNRIREGRAGYEVVTPLKLAGGDVHVLIDRGWIAAGAQRSAVPQVSAPAGIRRIEGLALERLPRAYQPSGYVPQGRVWQNLRLDEYRAATGLKLQPIVIEQLSSTDDGLLRDWPRPDTGIEKHEMYALQWYSLAALAVVLFLVLSLRYDEPAAG